MKIPVKITPDHIRDSIVQVFFMSDIPFEPLVGFCYAALEKTGWRYANRQHMADPNVGLMIDLSPTSQHFFVKDSVRLQLYSNQSLAFNCVNTYIGWEKYIVYIESVINALIDTGHFKKFNRIGMRYISQFPNVDILEKINFKFTLPSQIGSVENSSFRFSFANNGLFKTINISSRLPPSMMGQQMIEKVNFVSLIDVDVVQKDLTILNTRDLLSNINTVHDVEKETFFMLLTNEFLESLNPEYN